MQEGGLKQKLRIFRDGCARVANREVRWNRDPNAVTALQGLSDNSPPTPGGRGTPLPMGRTHGGRGGLKQKNRDFSRSVRARRESRSRLILEFHGGSGDTWSVPRLPGFTPM